MFCLSFSRSSKSKVYPLMIQNCKEHDIIENMHAAPTMVRHEEEVKNVNQNKKETRVFNFDIKNN